MLHENWKWKTIIEPFRIKTVEPLGVTDDDERARILAEAHYNLFAIHADHVLIDLLTDSGTSAMSAEQWASVMRGDESYAGARSFYAFESVVKRLTGMSEIIPVHQGRAAERILFSFAGGPGRCVVSNSHFDTTRANVEASGAEAIDLPAPGALDIDVPGPFKGDIDLGALERTLAGRAGSVALCIMTVTNNSLGGQPVSMANLRAAAKLCRARGVPLFLDCARFAENCWFIREREPGYADRTVESIAQEMFGLADGCMMSAKKDALVNIGGFLALKDPAWAAKARQILILGEGFPTYGGLAGRDLEAMATGLQEVLDERYLRYRVRSVAYLGEGLLRQGVPIIRPPGGHAVYVNARKFLPHIPPQQFPGVALACALYLEAGVRAVEIGTLMFGRRDAHGGFLPAPFDLVRLAIPRRVYTQSHVDFLVEVFGELVRKKESIRGLRVVEAPPALAHFTAKLEPA